MLSNCRIRVIVPFLFAENVNFLTADGERFAHPLHHLGKSAGDLPLIAIDSFRHMYLFPKFKDMYTPGKLKQFLEDLYSGKLHRYVLKLFDDIFTWFSLYNCTFVLNLSYCTLN